MGYDVSRDRDVGSITQRERERNCEKQDEEEEEGRKIRKV